MPMEDAGKPEMADPPFTLASAEFLIALPLGVLMLVAGGLLRVDATASKSSCSSALSQEQSAPRFFRGRRY